VSGAREIVQRFSWLLAFPPDPPPAPAWRRRRCSDRSLVLREHPTSRQRRCRAYGLWPSPTRPPSTAQRALTRSPSSCAKSFSACSGSMTAWSPPGTRENAPCGVAFRTARRRRRSKWLITRLNGWPAVSPVNASATPSRAPPHDSGAGWFAIPFLYRTFIDYSLPVSWRTVLSPLPRRSHWRYCPAHPASDVSLPRKGCRVGLRSVLFEACSAFTQVTAAHSRCHQFVARLPEGLSHFVTSMTAPVASGWSGCRVGLAPTGKRRLFTAHTLSGQSLIWPRRRSAVIRVAALQHLPARQAGEAGVDVQTREPPCDVNQFE